MVELFPGLTFHSNVAVVVAQILPTFFIAVAIQVYAVAQQRKRKWKESKHLIRLMVLYGTVAEVAMLIIIGIGGVSGVFALVVWLSIVGLILLFAYGLAVTFEAAISAAEQMAAAVPAAQPNWWQRIWSAKSP